MNKDKFNYAVESMKCIPEGTKEACLIIKEFLNNSKSNEEGEIIITGTCAVSYNQFIMAVKTLLASEWQRKEDGKPDFHHCGDECSKLDSDLFCPGEFQLSKNQSLKLCPYFIDSSNK